MKDFISKEEFKFLNKYQRQEIIREELITSKDIIRKKDLALKFNVTERTIARDIKEILQEDCSIMVICGRNGGYKRMKGFDNN